MSNDKALKLLQDGANNTVEYLGKVNQFAKENNTDKPRQQTAIEWLYGIAYNRELTVEDWKQAKEMEKQQIIEAFDFGDYCVDLPEGGWKQKYDSPEQYYEQTYGGVNQ
jgi:hypothetical protein